MSTETTNDWTPAALGSRILIHPDQLPARITRPDGEIVTVATDGPYVLTMPGEYLIEATDADPLRIKAE